MISTNFFQSFFLLAKHRYYSVVRNITLFNTLNNVVRLFFIVIYGYAVWMVGFGVSILADKYGYHNDRFLDKVFTILPAYYFFECLARVIFQSGAGVNFKPYLLTRINKTALSLFISFLSISKIINLFSILLLCSFCYHNRHEFASSSWALFLVANLLVIFIINAFTALIKLLSLDRFYYSLIYFFLLIAGETLIYSVSSIRSIAATFLRQAFSGPTILLVLAVLAVLICYGLFRTIYKGLHLEMQKPARNYYSGIKFTGLLNFISDRTIADLVSVEIKLMMRHERTRRLLFTLVVLIFYLVISRFNRSSEGPMGGFLPLLIFSGFAFGYGQYYFAWDGGHFGFLMTRKISFRSYVYSKFFVLIITNLVVFIPSLFIFWGRTDYLFKLLCCEAYVLGVAPALLLFMALYNTNKINIAESGTFGNWQGMGKNQLIVILPFILIPIVIMFICSYFKRPDIYYWVIAFIGILMLTLNRVWIKFITNELEKRKYQLYENFAD